MIELDYLSSFRESGRNSIIRALHGQISHGKTSVTFGNYLIVYCKDTFFEAYNAFVWYSSLLMIVHAAYTSGSKLHFESFIFA